MNRELFSVGRSLEYRIWTILRQNGWWVDLEKAKLIPSTDPDAKPNTYTLDNFTGKPFMFVGMDGKPWADGVKIFVAGIEVSKSTYAVDYRNGSITFKNKVTGAVTGDIMVSMCHMTKGYPEEERLKKLDLPIVSWTIHDTDGESASVGDASQHRTRFCQIDIIADNDPNNDGLLDDLQRHLAHIPLWDMSKYQPLDQNGALDPNFSFADQLKGVMRQTIKPRGSTLPPRQGGTQKERYRSTIALEVVWTS